MGPRRSPCDPESHFRLAPHATDPDGDSVSFYWIQYAEAGSYKKPVAISVAGISLRSI